MSDQPNTTVLAQQFPNNPAPDPPTRDDREELLAGLDLVLRAFEQALGLTAGTRGGAALRTRSRSPKKGDLVWLNSTLDKAPERTLGYLLEVEPGKGAYGSDRFFIDPIGSHPPCWWENTRAIAIPAGDLYENLLEDPDSVFQPDMRKSESPP